MTRSWDGFVSRDPIGYSGGDANLYNYVSNRPLSGVDPSGLVDGNYHGFMRPPGLPDQPPMSGGTLGQSTGVDLGTSLTPLVSDARDVGELLSGRIFFGPDQGRKMSWGEWGMTAVGTAIPVVGAAYFRKICRTWDPKVTGKPGLTPSETPTAAFPERPPASPAVSDSPYSPREVNLRQSELRRELNTGNLDPDSSIPTQGPGHDVGGHSSQDKPRHSPGTRSDDATPIPPTRRGGNRNRGP